MSCYVTAAISALSDNANNANDDDATTTDANGDANYETNSANDDANYANQRLSLTTPHGCSCLVPTLASTLDCMHNLVIA